MPLRMVRLEQFQIAEQRLIAPRLARLPLERADLPFHLADDVDDAQEIRLRGLQLPQRLFLLGLVLRDTGGFFENGAAILGPRGKDHVDLPLLHDGVGGAPDARVHEKLVDVLEPAGRLVQQILAAAVAENAARDRDFPPVEPERLFALVKGHRDLSHPDRRAGVGAGENDVCHFTAAQGFGGLLAEHPADGVEDV